MNVEYLKGPIRVFSGPICTESGRRVDQDRNRRALSDGLFIFLSRLLHDTEKLKKNLFTFERLAPIHSESGPRVRYHEGEGS